MTKTAQIASTIGFWMRLAIFLIFPLFYDEMQAGIVATACITLILATLVVEVIIGRTLWVSIHPLAWLIYLAFEAAIGWSLGLTEVTKGPFMVASFVLLFALSSDAISNSQRWKILVPATFLCWIFTVVTRPSIYPAPQGVEVILIPYPLMVYMLLPALSSLSRLFFPRTKHLIHTSLDYRFARMEVLSLGMKRVAAVGLRRNSPSPL